MNTSNIFEKIENLKPVARPLEFWKQISTDRYQCKISGKELNRVAFERYQLKKGGGYNFIIEILK